MTEWKCPHCGEHNSDNPQETAIPMCSGCDRSVDWEDVNQDA